PGQGGGGMNTPSPHDGVSGARPDKRVSRVSSPSPAGATPAGASSQPKRPDGAYRPPGGGRETALLELHRAGLPADEIALVLRKRGAMISSARVAECIRHFETKLPSSAEAERRIEVAKRALAREVALAKAEAPTSSLYKA